MDQYEYELLRSLRSIIKSDLLPSYGVNTSLGTILTSIESRINYYETEQPPISKPYYPEDEEDFKAVESFASKFIAQEKAIEPEIDEAINEAFANGEL